MNYLLFAATFFPISFMPGINMTLALSIGMSVGYARSLPMILGQLVSVGLVAICCILGIAALASRFEFILYAVKICGGLYVLYLGVMLFFSRGKLSVKSYGGGLSKLALFTQGALISVSNPKAWIFFSAILPPFLDKEEPLGAGMFGLVGVLLAIEFTCLSAYSLGGAALKRLLLNHLRALEIFTACLMCSVAVWILLG